jgi:hypothetical protein
MEKWGENAGKMVEIELFEPEMTGFFDVGFELTMLWGDGGI